MIDTPVKQQISRTTTLASTHRLILGDLTTPIVIHLQLNEVTGSISTKASHAIKTPDQAGPYVPDVLADYYQTLEAGLPSIVDGYETYYLQATEAGHTPSDSWLVPIAE